MFSKIQPNREISPIAVMVAVVILLFTMAACIGLGVRAVL